MSATPADVFGFRRQRFEDEFVDFLRCRCGLRRYMPTPDRFPFFCELVDAAKKYYVRVPRHIRNNDKCIPFAYFGRDWVIRMNAGLRPRPAEVYIDLCDADSKTRLVTVAVGFQNDLLEAVCDE